MTLLVRNSAQRYPALLALLLALLAPPLWADTAAQIESGSRKALEFLAAEVAGSARLLSKAHAVLVFPDIVKLGFGSGGQYGEGVLLVDDQPLGYYAVAGGPFGLPLGSRFKAKVIVFTNEEALHQFRKNRAWQVGVDGNIAPVRAGANGDINPAQLMQEPVVGFIFSEQGLADGLSFDEAKITRLAR
jgi:lipid-binding SYLF domain-containing protein